ncbi:hypothetical protein [Niveibacterium sp. COAC-50]|uniref:hypothetical protein n=1 Tax=Niveibacterium sp. COAC-50 TaxID=2729384 RepID=UPI0015548466|nr:hypothetical protein [Niveibacterium sp. COAC-50]
MDKDQGRLLALAIQEIRVLLAGHLGSKPSAEISVRAAAHLAYALHNEAQAVIDGGSYSVEQALHKIAAAELMLNTSYSDQLKAAPSRDA